VSEVQNEDGPPGSLRVGAAPIPGQGAPDTIGDIEGNTTVVAGGSNTVDIPYDASAQAGAAQAAQAGQLFLVIAIADLEGVFVDGFYTIPLSAIAGVVRVTIVFPQSLGEGSFLLCPATEFAGALSQYGVLQQDPADAGGGVLQVSLSFSPSQDLDLHVVEPAPNGEEIFFGHRTSAAGGMLDLDSNPGCSIDNINNENVTYPEGSNPIQGMYIVRVRMFARCVAGTTPFTIVLNNAGLTSSINGSFNAEEGGGAMREFMFTHPPSA
jgi:hypothetical protein